MMPEMMPKIMLKWCRNDAKHVRKTSENHPKNIRKSSETCPKIIRKTSEKTSENHPNIIRIMAEKCLKHVRKITKACPKNVRNMSKKCILYHHIICYHMISYAITWYHMIFEISHDIMWYSTYSTCADKYIVPVRCNSKH